MTGYETAERGRIGSRTARPSVAALLTAALVAVMLAGCQQVATDRHGAGEKLSEAADRSGGPERSSEDRDPAGGSDLSTGQPLPDLGLSWLRPPGRHDAALPGAATEGSVRLSELAGKPLVINVWAVWCTPCRDEIPHLQRLSEQAGERLRVIGVDYDDDPDAATALLDQLDVDYPQLADPRAELRGPLRLGLGIPVTVYVAPDGAVAYVARTPYRSLEQLKVDVERYLDVAL